jgi:hypothetical protein
LGGEGVVIMLAVVVYESLLGNTRRVAEAVAGGIRDVHPRARVLCGTPGEVGADVATADLLVVGAPTHFFGLPSRRSRRLWTRGYQRAGGTGASKPPLEAGAEGPGVREWLDGLPAVEQGRLAAAFDTRLRRATSGAAARRIARRLRRAGYQPAAAPAGFFVDDMSGPLGRGELERARAWGAVLVAQRVA